MKITQKNSTWFLICILLLPWHRVHGADPARWFRQQNVFEAPTGQVYDVPAWKTVLDGPIRASAAYDERAVYIGTAKGNFYALNRTDGKTMWVYAAGSAIHSTAAYENGKLYFTDNRQSLHCISVKDGKLIWKIDFGTKIPYEWRFDYYYSSPVISKNMIIVGGDDGYLYSLDKTTGKEIWKYHAGSVIRATPAIDGENIYFGDCAGLVHAVSINTGKGIWKSETKGVQIPGGDFPYDRKAIFSAAAIQGNFCIVGSRDGFLYGISKADGKVIWSVDYAQSWVISSAAIKDSMVITGTSDGRFVNALNFATGKEIWRYPTRNIVWASPTIVGDLAYIPSCDGVLHIVDVRTGKKVSEYRTANNTYLLSSPVFTDSAIIMASDEGAVFALKSRTNLTGPRMDEKKYVLWTDVLPPYFRNGIDTRLKDYFKDNGYEVIDTLGVIRVMTDPILAQKGTTIVVASPIIPDTLISPEGTSILRQYLDNGGKIILLGINPLLFSPKKILDIDYGQPDTRAYKGLFPAFPTKLGATYRLPAFWTAFASVDKSQVDIVLGTDENGLASAWVKNYGKEKRGALIQVWIEQTRPADYNFLRNLNDIN